MSFNLLDWGRCSCAKIDAGRDGMGTGNIIERIWRLFLRGGSLADGTALNRG